MVTTVSEILDRAAERLSKPGAWTQVVKGQNGPEAEPGGLCAANMVCLLSGGDKNVRRAAIGVLCEVIGVEDGMEFIWLWNDDPSRTQAEVVTAFRKAAAKAREQGK